MPVAPRPMHVIDTAAPPLAQPVASGAEQFAVFLSRDAIAPTEGEDSTTQPEAFEPTPAEPGQMIDTLLPLIEQQRAATVTRVGKAASPGLAGSAGDAAPVGDGLCVAPSATAGATSQIAAAAAPEDLSGKQVDSKSPTVARKNALDQSDLAARDGKVPEALAPAEAGPVSRSASPPPDRAVPAQWQQLASCSASTGAQPVEARAETKLIKQPVASPEPAPSATAAPAAPTGAAVQVQPTIGIPTAPAPARSNDPAVAEPAATPPEASLLRESPSPTAPTAPNAPAVAAPPQPLPATAATTAQALAAQVLDIATDGAWIDDLARDISRIAGGAGDLRFRLTPETLGELKVEISQSERGALIRMSASTEAVQAAIAEAQPRLLAEARAQGVRIADAQVDLASSQQNKGDAQQRHQSSQPEQPLRGLRPAHSETRAIAASAPVRADRYA